MASSNGSAAFRGLVPPPAPEYVSGCDRRPDRARPAGSRRHVPPRPESPRADVPAPPRRGAADTARIEQWECLEPDPPGGAPADGATPWAAEGRAEPAGQRRKGAPPPDS